MEEEDIDLNSRFRQIQIRLESSDANRIYVSEPSNADSLDIPTQESLRYRQDTKERKTLSKWVRRVVSLWLVFAAFILLFNHILCFNLSDTVICMLLGTTTINILGLAYIVLKGLFENKNR
ncbi:MAG: hypothetical protein LBQ65_04170 [Tannerellaceae bacterium]|jgi:hypothetical protein|nr:hypothetical protein [Tannerellaceae bacterium]